MSLIDDLVSYYKLDENSNDELGGNNGSDSGVSYTDAKIGKGAEFDASGDNISLGNPANLQIAGNISIAFWYKAAATNNTTGRPNSILMKTDDGSQRSYGIYQEGGTTGVTMTVFSSLNGATGKIAYKAIPDTNWHFWVMTFAPGGSDLKMYLDGEEVSYSTSMNNFSGNIANSTSNVYIGNKQGGGWGGNGIVDEMGIWDRILTADEVADLWAEGEGFTYPFDSEPPSEPFRFENVPGVAFDENNKQIIYAERLNDILDRLDALE